VVALALQVAPRSAALETWRAMFHLLLSSHGAALVTWGGSEIVAGGLHDLPPPRA
jgi:hypothetical protein